LNISRIIRSIITVCLSIVLLTLGVNCFLGLKENATDVRLYIKAIYIVFIVVSILLYEVFKKKLYKKISNNKLVYIYRYTYLAVIVFLINAGSCLIQKTSFDSVIALQILITFINVIAIKRIVFNISTSDTLSASAAILYMFLPKMIFNETMVFSILSYSLTIMLFGLLLILKIIDETSQHRMKTKKYIGLTMLLVINIIIGMFFEITSFFWISILLISMLASKNIDFTHISFGQKRIDKTRSISLKRLIYGIERININKLLIVFLITTTIALTTEYMIKGFNIFAFDGYKNLLTIAYNLLREARTYYISIFVVIILLDVIGALLGRKVDVKTAVIKWTLIGNIALIMFSKSIVYKDYIFDTLLILILVLNISNIYYNRDEKIKLLKEKN